MRAIDADALIDKYGDWYTEEGTEEGYIGTIKGIVDSMPTIEPERKTGEWLTSDDMYETGICSCCRYDTQETVSYVITNFEYCPSCGSYNGGAKMEKTECS